MSKMLVVLLLKNSNNNNNLNEKKTKKQIWICKIFVEKIVQKNRGPFIHEQICSFIHMFSVWGNSGKELLQLRLIN